MNTEIDISNAEQLLKRASNYHNIFKKRFSGIPQDERQSCINDAYMLALSTFDSTKNVPFEAYFYKHIEWQCLKWLKKEKTYNKLKYKFKNKLSYEDGQVFNQKHNDSTLNFWEMINELDEESQQLLIYRFVEDRTLTDIGNICNCSHETIRLKLNKILELLKKDYE